MKQRKTQEDLSCNICSKSTRPTCRSTATTKFTKKHILQRIETWYFRRSEVQIMNHNYNYINFIFVDSVQCDSVLIRSNKMQQYAGIYLLQVYSTRFGRPSRPSSGIQKTVTAASGTGHSI